MLQVRVVEADEAWPQRFIDAAHEIAAAMPGNLVELHHIGSTSIPRIAAKPVIDMLAVVRDLDQLDIDASQLIQVGYEAKGEFGIPGRRYFRRDNRFGVRTEQLHAFQFGSSHIDRHLAFRDYLRAHPDAAQEYSRLKLALAAQHPDDMAAYIAGKSPFILEVEARALAWQVAARQAARP